MSEKLSPQSSVLSPIGVFDSGVGGLTVFREISRALPHQPLIYLGDSARVPYGTKSPQTVIRYEPPWTLYFPEAHIMTYGMGWFIND